MDSLISTSTPTRIKLSDKFHKLIRTKNTNGKKIPLESDSPKIAAEEAFVAKIFAAISAIKASYAELQNAQIPYNADTIKSADESVVTELLLLSDLQERFFMYQVESSCPQVSILLSEIKEQQSLIKMYEISVSRLEHEIEAQKSECTFIHRDLRRIVSKNKLLENKFKLSKNPDFNEFIKLLNYATKSVRKFVKLLIKEMENVNWDIEIAAKSIESEAIFEKRNHVCFVFESFVCNQMFDQFIDSSFGFSSDEFDKLKSVNSFDFLCRNPVSRFAEFVRRKYFCLVPEKMEASFSGKVDQRKKIIAGEFPETEFFKAFVEMARRVWLLHCFGSCFQERVLIFQVKRKCRFSDVYMQSVTGVRSGLTAGKMPPVMFTVVPGFKIGRTFIQSQVYLSPAFTPYC